MKASDKKQFLAQYAEIHESLMRFCIVKSRGIMDPKDLANDVLLVGLENYHKLEDKKALLSYLFTTASRICLNKIRRRKFDGHYEADEAEKVEDPINNVDSRVDISLLYAALNELPELQKEAVILFEISDLPIKEIMVIQNAGASAVKQRIKRGREKLVDLMREKPQKKTAVVAAILFTSNSFSMSNLDAYFQVIKELPLPLSGNEVTAAVSNFQITGTATHSIASKIGSALLKKTILGSAIVGTVVGASILLSTNNDNPVANESIIALETSSDSIIVSQEKANSTNTVRYADMTNQTVYETSVFDQQKEEYIIIDDSYDSQETDIEQIESPIYRPIVISNQLEPNKSTANILEGDSYPSASVETVYLKNLGHNVEVKTWDKAEIKVIPFHVIEGKTPEDTEIIKKNIAFKVEKQDGMLTISRNSCMQSKQKMRSTKKSIGNVSFGNGDKAKFKKLELNYIVMLPATVNLKLTGNYKNLTIPAINGGLTARLFGTNLTLGSIAGKADLNLTNSAATMADFSTATMHILNSKINFKTAKKLDLTAKYSTVIVAHLSHTKLSLFDSDLKAESADNTIDGSIRYSMVEFETSAIDQFKLKAFDSDLIIPNVMVMDIELRYSTLTSSTIGSLNIPLAFDSEIMVKQVDNLQGISSKYSTYTINELISNIELHSFDDELTLLKTRLASMTFEGRSTTYNIKLASPANYKFDFDGNFGSLDYGNLELTTESYETKNDHKIINGYFEAGGNGKAKIKFKCFDSNIQLK